MFFIYLARLVYNKDFIKLTGANSTSFLATLVSQSISEDIYSLVFKIVALTSQVLGIYVLIRKIREDEKEKQK